MNDFLFTVEESLSPRLKWIKKHGILTTRCEGVKEPLWYAGFQEWHLTLSGLKFFMHETGLNGGRRIGMGTTEDDAIIDLIKHKAIRLWNEEMNQYES